ncbi:mitochondrial thiamine pyrophosphate transporter [Entomortierella beljakovae]|nr:mitochondrial thiamine pyrophosphate transporter [Entomortierella beljakovae]
MSNHHSSLSNHNASHSENASKALNDTKRSSITAGAPTLSKAETVLCGASAGVVSRFVIAPLDVVKIRLQMQTQRKDLSTILKRIPGSTGVNPTGSLPIPNLLQPKYRGMLSGMALIVREEGIRGLWKGNMAAEYLYLTYSGIQFLVYQQTKVFLRNTSELSSELASATASTSSPAATVASTPLHAISAVTNSSLVQSYISGANAGIIATAATYPFDLLRTRFAVQQDVKIYTGIIQACRHIYRADGITGFYRGMSPALIQVVPYMGMVFASYDTLKHVSAWIKSRSNVTPEQNNDIKTISQVLQGVEDVLCGALSGIISKTSVYPLDMVRKRLQIQGSEQQRVTRNVYSPTATDDKPAKTKLPSSVGRCIVHIVKTEGYLALYKGLLPGLVKAGPSSAVTFLVFSQSGMIVERYLRPYLKYDI